MAKRNKIYYTGNYSHNKTGTLFEQFSNQITASKNFRWIINMIIKFLETSYTIIRGNYLTVVTIFVVVLLSFIIPDLSQKIHATNDLKALKKVLTMMSEEVNRAEVACCTAIDKVCHLQCSMHDDATETARVLQDRSICTSHRMHTSQSEPVQVEKKIGIFRRIFFPNRNTSRKEYTIMSYLYTDSFDDKKDDI